MSVPRPDRRTLRLLAGAALVPGMLAVTTTPADAAARPDLVVTKVGLSSSSVTAGHTVTVTDVTKNRGAAAAGASVTRYYLSTDKKRSGGDKALGKRRVGRLAAGKRNRGKTQLTIPAGTAARPFHVIACADATSRIREKSEGNNCLASGTVAVTRPASSGTFPLTPDPIDVTTQTEAGTPDNPPYTYPNIFPGQATDYTTVGSDGTRYRFQVPAGALPRGQVVTIRPLTAVTGAPFALVAGVEILPAGIPVDTDATVTITPPQPLPDRAAVTGFTVSDHAGSSTTTHEFGLYPVSPTGAITVHLAHLGTFGIGTPTDAQRTTALAHPPSDPLAQVENVLGQTERPSSAVDRGALGPLGSTPSWTTSAAAAQAYWSGVLKPSLDQAQPQGSSALDATTQAVTFLRFWEVLGGAQPQWEADATTAILQLLTDAKHDASTRCTADHTMIDLLRLLIVAREFRVLGADADGDDAYDKFLRCAHFTVEVTDHLEQHQHYPQQGPAESRDMDWVFDVTSDTAPLDLDNSFQFVGTATLTEQVSGSEHTQHDCSPDPGFYSTTTTLTPSATGAVPVTLTYDLQQANYVLVNDHLVLQPPVGHLTVPISFDNGPHETVDRTSVNCGGTTTPYSYDDTVWGFAFGDAEFPEQVTILPGDATGSTMIDWTPPIYDNGGAGDYTGPAETNQLEIKIVHVPQ